MRRNVPVLEDLPSIEGRAVLVRTDFNVPMSGGQITDDLRIRLSLETLTWLLDHGAARVTTASHLGRPKGLLVVLRSHRRSHRGSRTGR